MGFRFRNRIKIMPNVYINLGKSGITSVSTKAGAFTSNFNRRGVKNTVGFHGTGVSYETERGSYSSRGKGMLLVCLFIFLLVIFFA